MNRGQKTENSARKNPGVQIRRVARARVPEIPFSRIAREILGHRYELSLVLCGDALARKMNRVYRKKGYAANVLSFPLDRNEGEIFLNLEAARREAKRYDVSLKARLALLFVHACLHLVGMRHGLKMEALEKRLLSKFS